MGAPIGNTYGRGKRSAEVCEHIALGIKNAYASNSELRKRIGITTKAAMARTEVKKRHRNAMLGNTNGHGRLGIKLSEDTKRKIGEAAHVTMLGNTYMLGHKHSKDAKRKMSKNCSMKRPEVARKCMLANSQKVSSQEAQVASVLHKVGLLPGKFEYNGQVDAGINICGKIPDFVDMKRKLIIEVHGGFYRKRVDKFVEMRAEKLSTYYSQGYQVLEFWDYELNKTFDPLQISTKLQSFISKSVCENNKKIRSGNNDKNYGIV